MWMNRTALSSTSAAARRARRAMFETLEKRCLLSVEPGLVSANLPGGAEQFSFAAATDTGTTTTDAGTAAVVGGSALGGNLNMQSDRIQDHPFTDLVRTTRGFYNTAGRTSGAFPALATTNAQGWPTEDFMFSVADNAEYGVAIDAGVYKMSFVGPEATTVAVLRQAPGGAGTVPGAA